MARAHLLRRHTTFVVVLAVGMGLLVATPSSAADVSPILSTAIINLGTSTTAMSDARILDSRTADLAAGSQSGTIVVSLVDILGNPITTDTLTVTDAGVGVLGTGAGSPTTFVPTGHTIAVRASTFFPGRYVFAVFADGTGGFTTIAINDGVTLIATKVAAFFGPIALLTAHQNLALLNVSGTPLGSNSPHNPGDGTFVDTPAVILTAKDANGVPVPDTQMSEFTAVSSDLTVISPVIGVFLDDTLGAGSLGAGTYNVQVRGASGAASGKSATLIFRYTEPGSPSVSTLPVRFIVSSSQIAKVSMSLNQSQYSPGDLATVTITAVDASGNLVSGQDTGNFFASSLGLGASTSVDKLLFPFTTVTFIDGKASTSFDVPTATGLFTLNGRLGNGANLSASLQGSVISVSAGILSAQDVALASAQMSAANAELSANAALAAIISLTALVQKMMIIIARIVRRLGLK
jgi:hypothetical protein